MLLGPRDSISNIVFLITRWVISSLWILSPKPFAVFFKYFALFLPWGQARDSIQGPLVSDQLDSIPNLGLNPWLQAKVYKQRVCFAFFAPTLSKTYSAIKTLTSGWLLFLASAKVMCVLVCQGCGSHCHSFIGMVHSSRSMQVPITPVQWNCCSDCSGWVVWGGCGHRTCGWASSSSRRPKARRSFYPGTFKSTNRSACGFLKLLPGKQQSHTWSGPAEFQAQCYNCMDVPVVPHKAVAEVSKIGNL